MGLWAAVRLARGEVLEARPRRRLDSAASLEACEVNAVIGAVAEASRWFPGLVPWHLLALPSTMRCGSCGDPLVGAGRSSLEPFLDPPLVGFVRQIHDSTGYGKRASEDLRGDRAGEGRPAGRALRALPIGRHRRAGRSRSCSTGSARARCADPAGILLISNPAHPSVVGVFWGGDGVWLSEAERDARIRRFAYVVQDKVVSVRTLAFERLRAACPAWGVGVRRALAVNCCASAPPTGTHHPRLESRQPRRQRGHLAPASAASTRASS